MKPRYVIGESVPQQRPPLGCFDDAESARQACAKHYDKTSERSEQGSIVAQPQTAVMA